MFPVVADVTDPETLRELPVADTVLYAVGYDRAAPQSIDEVYAGGVRNVIAALRQAPKRFIYVSTTGVYGDAAGGWIDEQTPPDPQRPGGQASLAAEDALCSSPLASHTAILRMAGLYGPGRIPFLDKLRDGEPIPAPQDGWLNLVHIDDAADVVVAVEQALPHQNTAGPLVLNVTDGRPVQRGEYYREVARLIGAPEPRFESPDPASPRALRAASNRRIGNARLAALLNLNLAYPSFREGLASALEGASESEPR